MFTVAVERGIVGSNYSQGNVKEDGFENQIISGLEMIYIKLYGIFSFFPCSFLFCMSFTFK